MISMKSTPLKVVVCLLALYAVPAAAQPTELFISEYIEGSSNNKAIEIYNGTGAPVDLAAGGYSIQMFFNGNPVAGLTISLTGTVAPGDVRVIAHALADAAILAVADQTNGSGWFNGDDAVVLRRAGVIIDAIGQAGSDPGTEWGSGLASTADNTLRRKGTVTGGDPNHTDAFDPSVEWDGFATNTFDGLGSYTPPPPPTPPAVREIHEIQGSGFASPFVGDRVQTLDNIVTAKTANGFFIQTPALRADASDQTSNGIFVFTGGAPSVQVGDQVDVTGTVQEFFELTELSVNPTIAVDSSGHDLPTSLVFGATLPSRNPPSELERFEGMRVRVENALVVGPTDGFGDTAVVANGVRPFREPGIEYPGIAGYPVTWDGNPEIFEITPSAAGLASASFVAGATIDVAEGPLSFSFGDYQIWPTTLTFSPAAAALPRPVRARIQGEFTVGSQNLLRLFDAVDDDGISDETPTPELLQDRLEKASLHIRTVLRAPDILAVQEVENIGVLTALATQINADDPEVGYSAHLLEGHDIGGIDTGFLVRNTVSMRPVTQIGRNTTLSVDGSMLNDRPALELQGEYTGNGAPFPITVIGIHNRSLGGIEGDSPSANRVRQKRLEQAQEIANYVQSLQVAEPNRRIVLVGDFNAFQFSDGYVDVMGIITGNPDPNGAIHHGTIDVVNPNLTDQIGSLPAPERYSYVFEGSAQVLDHTLTTQNLDRYLRGLAIARGNADAPASLRHDPTTPLATSDHDGEVLFVMTDFDADGFPDDVDSCRASVTTTVTVGACSTTVREHIFANGCSITDTLALMAASSSNHGRFVSEATQWLTDLLKDGAIDNEQRSEIHRCVARANIP